MSTKASSAPRLRVLIYGPQGSGKGTQGELLGRRFHIPVFSAGKIMRQEIAKQTPLGKKLKRILERGKYVDNPTTNALMRPYLVKLARLSRGFILDGYPRKLPQLTAFDRIMSPTVVINLLMPTRETIDRLGKRRVCPKGHTYHLVSKPPKRKGICDVDGLPLAIRHDDTPTALRSRLAEHRKFTEPVLARFKKRGLLLEIDGQPSIRTVSQDILRRLPPFLAQ